MSDNSKDPTIALYHAVAAYVENLGGTAIVIGGIEIAKWPDEPKFKYRLAIQVTGQMPEKPQ